MRLSFDDKESFMDVAESLRFDNPPSDPSTLREVGSKDSFPGTFPAIDSTSVVILSSAHCLSQSPWAISAYISSEFHLATTHPLPILRLVIILASWNYLYLSSSLVIQFCLSGRFFRLASIKIGWCSINLWVFPLPAWVLIGSGICTYFGKI